MSNTSIVSNDKSQQLYSWVVAPINDVVQGIRAGHYDSCYKHISRRTVPLPHVAGEKRVYLVCVGREMHRGEYTECLAQLGLKPCENAPNYLLGLMREVPESQMPAALRGKRVVAAEDTPSSVFLSRHRSRCFLSVFRDNASRELSMASVEGRGSEDWALLAEEA